MAGKLDEISVEIGEQRADIRNLAKTFDQHCQDDDRRHVENIAAINSLTSELRRVATTLEPLAESVRIMRPIVDEVQISRWKTAGAIGLAAMILTVIGWAVTLVAKQAVVWLFAYLR